jgi:hypothetical protein
MNTRLNSLSKKEPANVGNPKTQKAPHKLKLDNTKRATQKKQMAPAAAAAIE